MKVRSAATAVKIMAITTAIFMTCDSIPIASIVAAAFCNLAGDITLAKPPAIAVPAVTTRGLILSNFEVKMLYLVNRAMVEDSLPLTKPPKRPRYVAAIGYNPLKKSAELVAKIEIILKAGSVNCQLRGEGAKPEYIIT